MRTLEGVRRERRYPLTYLWRTYVPRHHCTPLLSLHPSRVRRRPAHAGERRGPSTSVDHAREEGGFAVDHVSDISASSGCQRLRLTCTIHQTQCRGQRFPLSPEICSNSNDALLLSSTNATGSSDRDTLASSVQYILHRGCTYQQTHATKHVGRWQ